MDSNEKNLDNSLESAMNMTQDEIERFLAEQENQGSNNQFGFDDADLTSLLSELGEESDSDIQEISNLLNRADNNEAVDDDVVALMNQQEAQGETAYDAMDLFSGEQAEKKEGFWKLLLNKFKRKKKDKPEETTTEFTEQISEPENTSVESPVDNSMAATLALLGGDTETVSEPQKDTDKGKAKEEKSAKKKKEKKPKKAKKEKKPAPKSEDSDDIEQIPEKSAKKKKDKKDKKEKKTKDKQGKEKKTKEKTDRDEEPIREKVPTENIAVLMEEEEQEPLQKKKIIMVFVAAVAVMLGFLVVNHYYTGHASKKLAEEAYEAEDYLECYQILYGQKLNDSQTAMFHRSELILKMDIFWNHYNEFVKSNRLLESLDSLVQFVYEYPKLSESATEWNCMDTIKGTYQDVVGILEEEYKVSEQEVLDIAALEKDVDYTRALVNLVEVKKENDAINQAYPDILPPEQDRITQN